jgi:hypothetical protein
MPRNGGNRKLNTLINAGILYSGSDAAGIIKSRMKLGIYVKYRIFLY